MKKRNKRRGEKVKNHKKLKEKKLTNRKLIIVLIFLFIIIGFGYFSVEKKIYENLNREISGDCGHFAVWFSSVIYGLDKTPQEITYQISPWWIITGPITVKQNLRRLGMASTFYNNFSFEQIKQKIDEKKPVIYMINVPEGGSDLISGSSHYLVIFKYNETGFFFMDAYYWPQQENVSQPVFFSYEDLEEKSNNVLTPPAILGRLENLIGLQKFAIVPGEAKKENINLAIRIMFYAQYTFERVIEFIGRIVVLISPRI